MLKYWRQEIWKCFWSQIHVMKLNKSNRTMAALMGKWWNIEIKKYGSASGRKYMWRNWTNPTEHDCPPQVANAHRPKTASCRATNECEWVTPTLAPRVQFSNKHQLLMITLEIFWVMWLQSFFPSSWGVRSPDPHRRVGRGTWLGTPPPRYGQNPQSSIWCPP